MVQNITIYRDGVLDRIYSEVFGYQLSGTTLVILTDANNIVIQPLDPSMRITIENVKEESDAPTELPDNVVSLV
jgi:ribosome recycling factor